MMYYVIRGKNACLDSIVHCWDNWTANSTCPMEHYSWIWLLPLCTGTVRSMVPPWACSGMVIICGWRGRMDTSRSFYRAGIVRSYDACKWEAVNWPILRPWLSLAWSVGQWVKNIWIRGHRVWLEDSRVSSCGAAGVVVAQFGLPLVALMLTREPSGIGTGAVGFPSQRFCFGRPCPSGTEEELGTFLFGHWVY